MGNKGLVPLVRKYFESEPLAAAHNLETMENEDAVQVLKELPPALTAQILSYIQADYAAALLKEVPSHTFKEILEKIDSQQAASIFINLNSDVRETFLELLPPKSKKQIQELLTYPEDSAGRIMTPLYLSFHMDAKVKDVIQKIRSMAKRKEQASYAYVVDNENRLVGVINMRDLMISPGESLLESIMRKEIFMVDSFMDREQVAEELSKRRYFAAPVVDAQKRLLGVVKAEQLIEDVQEEATEDFQKMFGAGGDERVFSPVAFSLKKRLPWLHVNLVTAFMAASVVALFEDIIAKITVLAVFLPVVAGQGGNAGAQSLAIVLRGLVMREIPAGKVKALVLKEALIGLITGTITGIVTGVVAWFWNGNPMLGVVIGLAMIVNLFMAALSGAGIPIFMKSVGLDPAQCSNIILTTVTDIVGFFSFLGFAVLFQHYLI